MHIRPLLAPRNPLHGSLVISSFSHQASVFAFSSPPYSMAHTHTHTHLILMSPSPVAGCLPGPWVIVVFRVRQALQSLRPPQCLPGSVAAIIRQLVWPNRLKRLWKTALAVTRPASSSQPTEKQDRGKNNTAE